MCQDLTRSLSFPKGIGSRDLDPPCVCAKTMFQHVPAMLSLNITETAREGHNPSKSTGVFHNLEGFIIFSRKGPTLGHSRSTLFEANVSIFNAETSGQTSDKKTVRRNSTSPKSFGKREHHPSQSSTSAVRLVEC